MSPFIYTLQNHYFQTLPSPISLFCLSQLTLIPFLNDPIFYEQFFKTVSHGVKKNKPTAKKHTQEAKADVFHHEFMMISSAYAALTLHSFYSFCLEYHHQLTTVFPLFIQMFFEDPARESLSKKKRKKYSLTSSSSLVPAESGVHPHASLTQGAHLHCRCYCYLGKQCHPLN